MPFFKKNLAAINQKDADLYKAIKDMDYEYNTESCGIDTAKNGSAIIYIIREGKKIYLNSRYNPEKEADNYVLKYMDVMDYAFMCFCGLSNGIIAKQLLKKLPQHINLYFFEPSQDIFMLALHNCDLTELFECSRVQIVVSGLNDKNVDVQLSKKLDVTTYMISRCESLPLYNQLFPEEVAKLQHIFHFQASTERNNVATFVSFGKRLVYNDIYNMRNMLNCNCEEEFEGVFPTDRPAIIVSAGPSLEKNGHLLIQAKGYMLIIAVDSAMPYLAMHNIVPDIVLVVDAEKPAELFMDDMTKKVTWAVSADANYEILEQTDQKVIFACSDCSYHNKIFQLSNKTTASLPGGGCVASYAVALAVAWGYRRIVLVGQDLAITPDRVHAGNLEMGVDRLNEVRIPVEGYYGDTVYTLRDYNYYRQWFESTIRINKDKLEIINSTEGGAKIQGSTQMSLLDVLEKYKKAPFDFEKTIKEMPPIITESQKTVVIDIWKKSCSILDNLKELIEEGLNLSQKGSRLIQSNNYTKKDLMNTYNDLCIVIEKCDENEEIAFLDRMTEAEHANILEDIYIVEASTDEEIGRMFDKMSIYMKAMYDSVDEVKAMFEKIISDVSEKLVYG